MTARESGDRGVSDLVAFTLTFSVIILSIGVVSVSGLSALAEVQTQTQTDAAEQAMEGLAETFADHRGDAAPRHVTDLQLSGDNIRREESSLEVSVNVTGGGYVNRTVEMGTFVRTSGETTAVAYTSGALFRVQKRGLVVVQRPPFRCDAASAHLALVNLRGDTSFSTESAVQVESTREGVSVLYPNVSAGDDPSRGVESVSVNVSRTRYPDAWERLFEDELAGWQGSDGRYTCDGIDTAVIRATKVGVRVVV